MKVLVNTTNTLRIANNVGAVVALFFFKILPTMNWCEWCPPLITVYCCFTSKWCSRSGRVVCPVAVVSYRQPSTATQKPTILEYSVCIIRISAVPGMLYDTVYIYTTHLGIQNSHAAILRGYFLFFCLTSTFQFLDKLWSQVSSLSPGACLQF